MSSLVSLTINTSLSMHFRDILGQQLLKKEKETIKQKNTSRHLESICVIAREYYYVGHTDKTVFKSDFRECILYNMYKSMTNV